VGPRERPTAIALTSGPEATAQAAAGPGAVGESTMGHTILLADDSVTVRRVVELAFQDTDIRVVAVGSGREALDRIASGRPDLVLADVLMPAPAGYDLCRAVKASDRAVPVLLLRGAFEPFDERLAGACGADGTVTKPFEAQGLVRRVRDLLAAGPTAPSPVAVDAPSRDEAEEAIEALLPLPGPASAEAIEAATGPEDTGDHRTVAAPHVQDRDALPVATADPRPPEPTGPSAIAVEPEEPGTSEDVGVRVVRNAPASPGVAGARDVSDSRIDEIVERVVARLSDRVVREIAWEVVPDLAAAMIRQRLREIEGQDPETP